jgi:hypothetical protein
VTVNLPVTISDSVNGASGHHDIVALSAVGDGTMPLGETGPHTAEAGQAASTPTVQVRYPRVNPGDSNQNRWDYPNWVLLMNYTWVGCPSASSVRASQTCSGGGGGGGGDAKAQAAVASKRLRLKKGKVKVTVRCTAPASERCKGKLRLRTRAKKPKLLASKKLNIAGGKKATITLRLSKKARKRLKKKTTKVQVRIDLGSAGTTAKNLKLKR